MSGSFLGRALPIDPTSKGKEFNEFAKIERLGPAMQRWLRESFNVYTVSDLAKLSINLVLSRLEDEEKAFCRHEVEHWIQQAKKFVAEQTSWQTFATFVVSLQSRQIGGQTEQRTTAYLLETDRKKIWSGIEGNGVYELMLEQLKHAFQLELEVIFPMEPESKIESKTTHGSQSELEAIAAAETVDQEVIATADSLVQLETVPESASELEPIFEAVDMEVNHPELKLHPIAQGTLHEESNFFLELAPKVALEGEIKTESGVAISRSLAVEITQLKFWQVFKVEESQQGESTIEKPEMQEDEVKKVIVVNMAQRSLPAMLRKGRPFELEVAFQIVGDGAVDLTQQPLQYCIQCFIQSRESTVSRRLVKLSTGALTKGELIYTSRLPEITLQQPGAYRLQIITKLAGGYVGPDIFELPFVAIV